MTHIDTTDEQMPIGVAARHLGVSVETVRRWERAGLIQCIRTLGGQRRFYRSEIERIKAECAA